MHLYELSYCLTDYDMDEDAFIGAYLSLEEALDLWYPPDSRHWYTSHLIDILTSVPFEYFGTPTMRGYLDELGLGLQLLDEDLTEILGQNSRCPASLLFPPDLSDRIASRAKQLEELARWEGAEYFYSPEFSERAWKNPPGRMRPLSPTDFTVPRTYLKFVGGSVHANAVREILVAMIDEVDLALYPHIRQEALEQFAAEHGRRPDAHELASLEMQASIKAHEPVFEKYFFEPRRRWANQVQQRRLALWPEAEQQV